MPSVRARFGDLCAGGRGPVDGSVLEFLVLTSGDRGVLRWRGSPGSGFDARLTRGAKGLLSEPDAVAEASDGTVLEVLSGTPRMTTLLVGNPTDHLSSLICGMAPVRARPEITAPVAWPRDGTILEGLGPPALLTPGGGEPRMPVSMPRL